MTLEGSSSLPDYGTHPTGRRRKSIPATCQLHRSPIGFANLMVSKHDDGTIVFDPHVTGSCAISLDEEGARKLCDLLTACLR